MARFNSAFGYLGVPIVLSAIVGCGADIPESADAIAPSSPQPTSELANAPTPSQETDPEKTFEPIPGRYCYLLNNGILATYLRFTLDDNNQIKGDARSSTQNEEASFLTSAAHAFSGTLTQSETAVDITTWIEEEVQNTNETWTLTDDTLQTKDNIFNLTDCQLVDPAFQDYSGLEAQDLINSAANLRTRRVEFEPDTNQAVISNSVLRGDRDVYLLKANGGQQMSVSVQSLEDNAVLDVISPSGYILAFSALNETLILPHTGDYRVVIGGTRGNATYELTISIQ
ncbi:hypothetical protein N836_17655 [Leptolyngbya sp. Heron Island J]|uniref:hypothetical protein n=1 Tax=Leptolyngbya sp. Heron Island J TaxID=1385935 RepID=UPI0003B9A342|nr:hypothetical protein [Leptolyngbya sp. Heron Island J]ESA34243.1 hypothetical protein N836_17655 [Leptolyngbya sp. Heron Island J]